MDVKSRFDRYESHMWSNDTLEVTADLLESFDYSLLVDADLKVRKLAMLWISMLIARPRIMKMPNERFPYHSIQSSKVRAILTLPFVEREGILFYEPTGCSDEETMFHIDVSRKLTNASNKVLEKCLLASFPGKGSSSIIRGFALLNQVGQCTFNINVLLDDMPDAKDSRIVLHLDSSWKRIRQLEYLRIGGGEESLPSCSSFLSEHSEKEPSSKSPIIGSPNVGSLQVSIKGPGSLNGLEKNSPLLARTMKKFRMVNVSSHKTILPVADTQHVLCQDLDPNLYQAPTGGLAQSRASSMRKFKLNKMSASPSPKKSSQFKISKLAGGLISRKSVFLERSSKNDTPSATFKEYAVRYKEVMPTKQSVNVRSIKPSSLPRRKLI